MTENEAISLAINGDWTGANALEEESIVGKPLELPIGCENALSEIDLKAARDGERYPITENGRLLGYRFQARCNECDGLGTVGYASKSGWLNIECPICCGDSTDYDVPEVECDLLLVVTRIGGTAIADAPIRVPRRLA